MNFEDPSPDYTGVVDSVMHLFGEVMSRDAVCAIVEHCGGDLTQSVDIIVNMSDDKEPSELPNTLPTTNNQTIQPTDTATDNATASDVPVAQNPKNSTVMQKSPPKVSYAGAYRAKAASPKQPLNVKQPNAQFSVWTLQIQQIVEYHNQGSRTLILLRGLPGSGKTTLARELVQVMCPGDNYKTYVFSTDDFFMNRGRYEYNKSMIPEAHYWNQNRVREAIGRGLSPIFVDNTNVEVWEMESYVRFGVSNGYIIEVLEPNTPWAKKVNQLARKNSHDVPISSIRRMLDNYRNGVSGVYLLRCFGLSYPADKVPPVVRNIPPFIRPDAPQQVHQTAPSLIQAQGSQVILAQASSAEASPMVQNIISTSHLQIEQPGQKQGMATTSDIGVATISSQETLNLIDFGTDERNSTNTLIDTEVFVQQTTSVQPHIETPIQDREETTCTITPSTISVTNDPDITLNDENTPEDNVNHIKLEELRTQIEQIEKLEAEWENGDDWNDDSKPASNTLNVNASAFVPKPPRNAEVDESDADRFLPSTSSYNDWSKIAMFMPAWNEAQCSNLLDEPIEKVETATKGTNVEFSDTDDKNTSLKILTGTPKDINFYYTGLNEKKIPNKRMLDKSSMTNDHDHVAIESPRCPNGERHFVAFRKLFKNISKDELRDIFDNCVGDVNWAVNIVLDGMANNQLATIATEDISDTEDFGDEQCECLAKYNIIPTLNTQPRSQSITTPNLSTPVSMGAIPKTRKEKIISESSIQLKRQIEQNVVISDDHYSDHCLKIRKMRRGEVNDGKVDSNQEETEESVAAASSEAAEYILSTDDDDSQTSSDDCEQIVNVDLGAVFVSELDDLFGRRDMAYPENVLTRVNMPVSLLNEINALWIESFMYQLDQQSRQSEIMLRQDEEFARQLALKEEQLAQAGQEPAVPDLKDIIDMELALSIYKKEITAEWRSNEPNDLAARMTREKLYNLFPDVLPEILSELLMAHDSNFQATVEVLLSSTGNGPILEEENGVAKFIAKKELERHEKLIEEQKKALSEVEWPLLPKGLKVDMKTVQEYRRKASEHLAERNKNYQRAQSYFNRDMTQIATYYSDVAVLHKKKYDHASSLAAASLMQMHAENCTNNATIDLHYLHVPEAKETLDLFLDTHIQKLRESQARGGPRFHTLFFITGRGLHSRGGPRIKPAVKRRLRERGIAFFERNPGLLSSKVCAEDKLTYQVP